VSAQLEPYGWPFAVLRMRPRAKWMKVYDEIFAGLTTGGGAISCNEATIALLEAWPSIVERLRREARNTRRRELYRIRKVERERR
jgi:hypothetical protein